MRPAPILCRLAASVALVTLLSGPSPLGTTPLARAAAPPGPASGGGTSRTYELGGHGALLLNVPTGWKEKISRAPGDLPPTINFEPAAGADFQVLVSPIWGPPGMPVERFTAEDARSAAETQGRKILESSVETDLTLKEIKGEHAVGYVYALTDKSLVDKAPADGEYRCITQGAVLVGDLLMIVTVLTQEHGTEAVRAALEMIRTARLRA